VKTGSVKSVEFLTNLREAPLKLSGPVDPRIPAQQVARDDEKLGLNGQCPALLQNHWGGPFEVASRNRWMRSANLVCRLSASVSISATGAPLRSCRLTFLPGEVILINTVSARRFLKNQGDALLANRKPDS
jgi:hypothetical protein